jgi:hypothetical protein
MFTDRAERKSNDFVHGTNDLVSPIIHTPLALDRQEVLPYNLYYSYVQYRCDVLEGDTNGASSSE